MAAITLEWCEERRKKKKKKKRTNHRAAGTFTERAGERNEILDTVVATAARIQNKRARTHRRDPFFAAHP